MKKNNTGTFYIKILKDDKKVGWWKKGSETYPPVTETMNSATKLDSHIIAAGILIKLSQLFTDYNFQIHKIKNLI